MRKVAVVGAGKIGSTVVDLLVASGDYEAVLIDQSAEALAEFTGRAHVATRREHVIVREDFFELYGFAEAGFVSVSRFG